MELAPLKGNEIVIGKPLPWPVFDRHEKLLLREGGVIETQHQLEVLMSNGLFRNKEWKPPIRSRNGEGVDQGAADVKNGLEKQSQLIGLKLNIGESLQMQSLTDQNPERYYVKLIGYIEKRSVMVTTPVVDGSVLLMREGQAFVLRGFSGKDTYAFNVNILRVCNMPFPYLHLSYPALVQSTSIRRHNRIKANIVVSASNLTHPGFSDKTPAVVVDLSLTGAMLDARKQLGEKGDTLAITLRVVIDDMDAYLVLDAMVRNVRSEVYEGRPEPVFHHGLEFLEMPQKDKMILQNFVYSKIVEGL